MLDQSGLVQQRDRRAQGGGFMSKHQRSLSRRAVLAGTGAGIGLLAAPGLVRAQSKRLVFATWGGSWEKALRSAWFDPFTQKTGIPVVTVGGNTYGKIGAMVAARRMEWDVVEVNPDFQWIGARDNLLEKLDFTAIDRSGVMTGEDLVTDYSVPQVLWSRVMFTNTRALPEGKRPATWAEVWDTTRFPGKRTFASKANGGALEAALLADGVPMEKIYPLDVPRALKMLERIKNDIVWYDTNAQSEQFMSDGQAVMGLVPDGRALSAIERGAPVAIEYNQSMMTWSTMVVPKGAPNRDAAMQFLNYTLSAEAQAAIAKVYTYGPVTPAAFAQLPAERAGMLSGGPQQKGRYVLVDEHWWGDNLASVTETVNAWRLG
jgi:putative spermidine/putrescine transport system substrate-binding protein